MPDYGPIAILGAFVGLQWLGLSILRGSASPKWTWVGGILLASAAGLWAPTLLNLSDDHDPQGLTAVGASLVGVVAGWQVAVGRRWEHRQLAIAALATSGAILLFACGRPLLAGVMACCAGVRIVGASRAGPVSNRRDEPIDPIALAIASASVAGVSFILFSLQGRTSASNPDGTWTIALALLGLTIVAVSPASPRVRRHTSEAAE